MIDLTPLEVRQKKGDFRRAVRGYDPELVNDFLDLVADRLEELVRENLALRDAAGSVQDELTAYRHKEQALSEALMAAQQLREDARGHAEREGDLVLREARLAAETMRHEARRQAMREEEALRQVRARRVQLVESFRQLLERQMRELDVIQETLELRADPTPSLGAALNEGSRPAAGEADVDAGEVPGPTVEHPPTAGEPDDEGPGAERVEDGAAAEEEPDGTDPWHLEPEPLDNAPLNLEWPAEQTPAGSATGPGEPEAEKRLRPEGFDAADATDDEQDDWLSSLMEED